MIHFLLTLANGIILCFAFWKTYAFHEFTHAMIKRGLVVEAIIMRITWVASLALMVVFLVDSVSGYLFHG